MLALLIDPEKAKGKYLKELLLVIKKQAPDFIFIGGSTAKAKETKNLISELKKTISIPLIQFPGPFDNVNKQSDAFLLLSLISGRNPDLIIGKHVEEALTLKKSKVEIISTAYILIDGGRVSTTEKISGTKSIKLKSLAIQTALAGELLGMKLIYLEAGSGANKRVSDTLIKSVRSKINVPLIVGGGIKNSASAHKAFKNGADLIVVGNAIEKNVSLLSELIKTRNLINAR